MTTILRRTTRRAIAAVVLPLFIAFPSVLCAQSATDAATARTLFNEARTLAAEGKHAEACPKFEESLRLNRGIGTQFNLADCWERTGRIASAWGLFLEVAAGARASGQADREVVARERATALEAKLSKLVIQVDSPAQGLEIKRDGQVVGAASWRTPMPSDPGTHTLEASAPGKKSWKGNVVVPATPGTVTAKVPALEDAPDAPAPAAASAPAPGAEPLSPVPTTGPPRAGVRQDQSSGGSSWNTQKTLALVSGGVGVAGAVVGTIFYLDYRRNNDDAEAICPQGTDASDCPQGSKAKHDALVADAEKATTPTYIGWGVGAAGLAGAAVLWFTAPSGKAASSATRLQWGVAPVAGGWSSSVRGTW